MTFRNTGLALAGASALVLALSGALAAAQTPQPGETSRGVRILEAQPDPEPAPVKPAPAPPKPAPKPTPVIKFCSRPFDKPDLTLAAQTTFDRDLGASLKTRKRVVVDLDKPYKDEAAAPAAIAPWLSEVKAGGGTVTVKEYCEAARGNLGTWLANIFGSKPATPQSPYRAARQYNVILHADALDKVITQVEFAPKTARAGT